jgi:hypothetical protein
MEQKKGNSGIPNKLLENLIAQVNNIKRRKKQKVSLDLNSPLKTLL